MRAINAKIDALFVEGPDDGSVVNALVERTLHIDISHRRSRLVRTNEAGGGDAWALRAFRDYVELKHEGARVGLILDRDSAENVAGILPESPVLSYASEASRIAKETHGAEYQLRQVRKVRRERRTPAPHHPTLTVSDVGA
jgi:hypothetical protein